MERIRGDRDCYIALAASLVLSASGIGLASRLGLLYNMTNRRWFLKAIAATLVLDPEKLLWQPGKKLISIPSVVDNEADLSKALDEFRIAYLRPAMIEIGREMNDNLDLITSRWNHFTPLSA
jgi:hypothetical protein